MNDCRECSAGPTDDPASRLDQIADAALRRFSRYGYKRSSMDDIAREAGLAKATLYLHCKGKEEVFRAMLLRFCARVEARCAEVLTLDAAFPDRLTALLEAHFGTAYAAFGPGEHLHELKTVMSTVAAPELVAFEDIFQRFAARLLRQAQVDGEIVLEALGADAVIATLVQAAIGAKMGLAPSPEAYAERLRQLAAVVSAAITRR